eukprot:3834464-Alexandrium_andersonii.AAC.1
MCIRDRRTERPTSALHPPRSRLDRPARARCADGVSNAAGCCSVVVGGTAAFPPLGGPGPNGRSSARARASRRRVFLARKAAQGSQFQALRHAGPDTRARFSRPSTLAANLAECTLAAIFLTRRRGWS